MQTLNFTNLPVAGGRRGPSNHTGGQCRLQLCDMEHCACFQRSIEHSQSEQPILVAIVCKHCICCELWLPAKPQAASVMQKIVCFGFLSNSTSAKCRADSSVNEMAAVWSQAAAEPEHFRYTYLHA